MPVAVVLVAVGVPVAVVSFLRLVPAGTIRLAPGMPAAILLRGLLTFAFFGADAYVSLTFPDVRGRETLVAGLALPAATTLWNIRTWPPEPFLPLARPSRLSPI